MLFYILFAVVICKDAAPSESPIPPNPKDVPKQPAPELDTKFLHIKIAGPTEITLPDNAVKLDAQISDSLDFQNLTTSWSWKPETFPDEHSDLDSAKLNDTNSNHLEITNMVEGEYIFSVHASTDSKRHLGYKNSEKQTNIDAVFYTTQGIFVYNLAT